MSNYTVTTNFGSKDSLPSGSPNKVIKGSEFSTEFNNLVVAVNSKADLASPALTGSATAVNLTVSGNFEATLIDGGTY